VLSLIRSDFYHAAQKTGLLPFSKSGLSKGLTKIRAWNRRSATMTVGISWGRGRGIAIDAARLFPSSTLWPDRAIIGAIEYIAKKQQYF
jgi:hypothetical protein